LSDAAEMALMLSTPRRRHDAARCYAAAAPDIYAAAMPRCRDALRRRYGCRELAIDIATPQIRCYDDER